MCAQTGKPRRCCRDRGPDVENAQKVADSIVAAGGKALAMDVTNEDDVNAGALLAGFESAALTGQSVIVSHGWSMK